MLGPRKTLERAYGLGPTDKPTDTDEKVPPKPKDGQDQALAAAYGAAVAHVIDRPDGIRARAQVSATISAAVAAALAAFAPLTSLGTHAPWTRILIVLAVLGWLVSLWRYILVIGYSMHDYEIEIEAGRPPKWPAGDPTDEHLRRFLLYASHMRARVERGTAATVMALIWTLSALVALTTEPLLWSPEKALVVSLSPDGREAVESVCDDEKLEDPLAARGLPGDLDLSVVPLKLDAGACKNHAVVVHLRRGWVVATRRAD
jgi:hypothetical protein